MTFSATRRVGKKIGINAVLRYATSVTKPTVQLLAGCSCHIIFTTQTKNEKRQKHNHCSSAQRSAEFSQLTSQTPGLIRQELLKSRSCSLRSTIDIRHLELLNSTSH